MEIKPHRFLPDRATIGLETLEELEVYEAICIPPYHFKNYLMHFKLASSKFFNREKEFPFSMTLSNRLLGYIALEAIRLPEIKYWEKPDVFVPWDVRESMVMTINNYLANQ